MPLIRFLLLAAGICLAPVLHADPASDIKAALEKKLRGASIDSVRQTPHLDLYEVVMDGQILYTDPALTYLIAGNLIELSSLKNLTKAREQELARVDFSSLPLDQAFKEVRGNGKRQVAYFADPNCGYCKRFEQGIAQVTDVTIHTFLYPILGQDSINKANAVWCSRNRQKAWEDWMLRGVNPQGPSNCDTPIDANRALGKKLRINGTPALIFTNGERVPGAIDAATFEAQLNAAARR